MRIKSDYVPRAQQRAARTATAICPNCGQQIPVSELDAHLRIELLDPRWKEQQAKAAARFSTTNLGGTDVAANLKRLRAKTDGTGSGSSGDPLAEAAARVLGEQEEEERRKRMRMEGAPDVGGNYPGIGVQPFQPGATNVQEQIRQIHNKYKS